MKNCFKGIALVGFLFVAACGGGGGGTASTSTGTGTGTGTGTTTSIGGTAVKGLMATSTVKVYSVDATGVSGTTALGTTTTDSSGKWGPLTVASAGVVRIEVTGGSYANEAATTSTVTNSSTFTALADLSDSSVAAKSTALTITPVSTFVDKRAVSLIGTGETQASAITKATTAIKTHLGLSSDPLLVSVNLNDPTAITTNPDGTKLGLVLGAITQEAKTLGITDPGLLVAALADDFSDGVFDGKKSATAITITTGSTLGVGAGSTDLSTALTSYLGNTLGAAAAGGITASNSSTVVSSINGSIATSGATAAAVLGQANVSTSSAVATYIASAKNKLYLAGKSQAKGLVIYDTTKAVDVGTGMANTTATATSNPSILLIQDPALTSSGTCSASSTSSCFVVDGVAVFNNKSLLALYSFDSPYIVFIDLTTDAVATVNPNFNTGMTTYASFSGGSALVAGAIADNTRNGLWVATGVGYHFIDMSAATYTITTSASTANSFPLTSTTYVAENIGANVADTSLNGKKGYLIAPNYYSLDFLDIGKNFLYKADAATATAILGSSSYPNADHGAVDTVLNVGIFAQEAGNTVGLVDFNKATFDDTAKTWAVDTTANPKSVNKWTIAEASSLSAVAVESSSHMALFIYQWGGSVVIAKLDSTNPSQIKDYVAFDASTLAVGNYSGSDPHAIAVGVDANSNAIGYAPNTSSSKTLVFNMTNLLDSTKYTRSGTADAAGVSHTLASTVLTTAETNKDIKAISY